MTTVVLAHSDLAQHQAGICGQLQTFWKQGQLCDVVVKSREGQEHYAHTAVLCAASTYFRNMLVGSFLEADKVRQGQPVQITASNAVVSALLQYIYGGQPELELEDSMELLRLADAYSLPQLGMVIEARLRTALDKACVATALKVLRQTQDLHDLRFACEEKVAANFESCIELPDFLQLSASQLGRLLQRTDLRVSREEVVLKGLFNWFKSSESRGAYLGLLLQNVDFHSFSSRNLAQIECISASMGPNGHDLKLEVEEALRARKKRSASQAPDAFRPKRLCLPHWSPELGASSQVPRKVLPSTYSMCSHEGAIYYHEDGGGRPGRVLSWKPGDSESRTVAGRGAGIHGKICEVSVSPDGEIYVADILNQRLQSFRNGSGNLAVDNVTGLRTVFCSPNGVVYFVTGEGTEIQKLNGATLQPLISSDSLPEDLQFGDVFCIFVTKEEKMYICDRFHDRILRLNPGEAEPVVVGAVPHKKTSDLLGLFVTKEEKIYVSDREQRKVFAFHQGDAAWTEVLACPEGLGPCDLLVQGRSLYVNISLRRGSSDAEGIYEYLLPPELQLE